MFSYGGQHEDELCFETGDIITLISKVNFELSIKTTYRDCEEDMTEVKFSFTLV